MREKTPRAANAAWVPSVGRDVLNTVLNSSKGRLVELLPIKMGRMAVSPFSFYRGCAPLMAADLSTLLVTGMHVQICGDAHVRNLGAYATPDGHLVFDLNDFDETIRGPWEWDLKRLATSIVLAGREAGSKDTVCLEAVHEMMRLYRESMSEFANMSILALARFEIRRAQATKPVRRILHKAERQTPLAVLRKLATQDEHGIASFHDRPPVLKHVPSATAKAVLESLTEYRETLGANRQLIFDAFKPVDVAFKVVGTGSVGTRDYVVLMFGHGTSDPLFIQVKEALPSCYEPYLPKTHVVLHHGQRVAQGQQRMQTVSDPFLGWTSMEGRRFLVRQLADHKASIKPEALHGTALTDYALICGETLAKAHARTGDAAAIAGYCGDSDKLDTAITKFARTYADRTEQDHKIFCKAIRQGHIKAAKV